MQSVDAIEQLAQFRERFLAYVSRRVSDPVVAEDIVQASLVKAAESIGSLRNEDSLVPWFYSILRNAITDTYRVKAKSLEVTLPPELDFEDEPAAVRNLCECFVSLLPALRPEYADVIDSLDLRSEPAAATAGRLGITPNNLKVRHHRARQALRKRLEETCRVCAEHHCLDCTCRQDSEAVEA
jgi:RNA polymerase sigma-70 factor (ECF subfamily)